MNFRKSIPTFVFGLSIGLLLGIAFFLFKINDIFKSLKDNVKEQVTIVEKPSSDEQEKVKNKERFKINIKKSNTKVNYKEVDSLIKQDKDLNVATDELISIKNIKIIHIENENAGDSATAKLAGIENKQSSGLCFIEFWKTPLNSKGYRYTKNKLQLYGFGDFNDILIYKINDDQYLKTSDQVFKLYFSSEFKKLEKVQDTEVLAKLN